MGLISDIRDGFKLARNIKKNQRSFNEWLAMLQNSAYNHEPDFLDANYPGYLALPQAADKYIGVLDQRVDPRFIYEMINRDPYVTGLFDTLIEELFRKDFYVDVMQDENGNELGSKNQAQKYRDELRRFSFEDLVKKQVFAEWADGGGNALMFTVKTDKGLEFRVEPFLYNGRPRVRVYGDIKLHKIIRYEVIDETMQTVYNLDPQVHYLYHLRYSSAGDFRFSSNPAKKAVYWYILKRYLAGANTARFKNGLQNPTISSPDYQGLAALITASQGMQGKASSSSIPEYLKNPMEFISRQNELDTEVFREHTGRADKTGQFIRTNMPYKYQDVGANNRDMQVKDLIELCDEQMGYSFRTSKGVLNTTDSKYSNAEIERDNWDELVVDPIKRKIEKLAEEFYLPVIDPKFDNKIYRVRFGRDPDAENLAVYNEKTQRNQGKATILVQLAEIPNIAKYNFETDEIEPVTQVNQNNESNDEEPDQVEDNDEIVEGKDKERKLKRKGIVRKAKHFTIAHRAIESTEGKRFRGFVKRAIEAQTRAYANKLDKYKDVKAAQNNLRFDLKPISVYGISVNTYKQQLLKVNRFALEDFKQRTGKMRADEDLEYPQNVLDMLDTKSQLMVKGYDSLNDDQRDLIKLFYHSPKQNRSLKTYQGFDYETTSQINTIFKDALAQSSEKNPPLVKDIRAKILEEVPELSANRATVIVNTEIAQSVNATRYNLYIDAGYDEKKWINSGDELVREEHRAGPGGNSGDDWIGIDEAFSGDGSYTPADAINCRCDLLFRRSSDSEDEGDSEDDNGSNDEE